MAAFQHGDERVAIGHASRYDFRVRSVLVGVCVGLWTAVASAKGHPPDVAEEKLATATLIDGVEVPAGAVVTRTAEWDDVARNYKPPVLTEVLLVRPATVCNTQLPAGVPIEVRHGLIAFVDLTSPPHSTATHLVWSTKSAIRVGDHAVQAGDWVGVECPSGGVRLLHSIVREFDITTRGFDVATYHVDGALWYPAELGAGLMSVHLRRAAVVAGIRVPADFMIAFAPGGALATVSGPPTSGVVVDGRLCWTWGNGDEIRIDHGHAHCVEANAAGVRCDANNDVVLHDGSGAGHLARCVLAAPFTSRGRTWPAGKTLRFDIAGSVIGD